MLGRIPPTNLFEGPDFELVVPNERNVKIVTKIAVKYGQYDDFLTSLSKSVSGFWVTDFDLTREAFLYYLKNKKYNSSYSLLSQIYPFDNYYVKLCDEVALELMTSNYNLYDLLETVILFQIYPCIRVLEYILKNKVQSKKIKEALLDSYDDYGMHSVILDFYEYEVSFTLF